MSEARLGGGVCIEVPDGLERVMFFGRLVNAGMCRYESLVCGPSCGGLTIAQVFDLHRMLDLKEYIAAASNEKQRESNVRNG